MSLSPAPATHFFGINSNKLLKDVSYPLTDH